MSPSTPAAAGGSAREALTDAALLALDTALTVGAALRVTRFATTDVLGGWVLADPAKRWADRHEPGQPFGYLAPPSAPLHRLVSALDCPYCVGTQAALVIGAALASTSRRPPLRPGSRLHRTSPLGRSLRAVAASLTAAYVVGHVSHRLDTSAAQPQPQPQPQPAPAPTAKDSK